VTAADFFLEHMSRTLWDPVDPRRLGSLDPRLQARVNGEIYRFSSAATLAQFRRTPLRWCGILRDPVTGERFKPRRRAPRHDYRDGPYYFAADSTRAAFRANPERYAIHRGGMPSDAAATRPAPADSFAIDSSTRSRLTPAP
jgi:YHS domain-containing protein